ncbi:hypothetical protein [Paenibacillus lactis]|uniref:Uncharacterized protein n=1 Tax=Paenibacillus lactis 154 TaxID=743719 RepID=G4HJR9_9BACL|nr:hypothetical protein [Paenibacillus lactis]EHB62523.1 hypothetical protein PaelaDRAFT_4266 [Paenibacillus lactis 154]
MITNKEYKEQIEKRYGKPLKEVMYELVVNRNLDQWDGSKELGISKDLFVKWRTEFRLGPYQRSADLAEKRQTEKIAQYKEELKSIDLNREFIYQDEESLRGFKEIIERMLELEKQRGIMMTKDASSNLSMIIQTGVLETIIDYIAQYEEKKLIKKYNFDLEWLLKDM